MLANIIFIKILFVCCDIILVTLLFRVALSQYACKKKSVFNNESYYIFIIYINKKLLQCQVNVTDSGLIQYM